MRSSDDPTLALGSEFFSGLEPLFALAAQQGARRVTIDCVTRKVTLEMQRQEQPLLEGTPEEYFDSLCATVQVEDKVRFDLERWRGQQYADLTPAHYTHYLSSQLERLLQGDFLSSDGNIYLSDIDLCNAELAEWGLAGRGHESAYCILHQIMPLRQGRLTLDKAVAGRYLALHRDSISLNGIRRFFYFVSLCQIVYGSIDALGQSQCPGLTAVPDAAIVAQLLPMFKSSRDEAERFVNSIRGAQPKIVVEMVNELISKGVIAAGVSQKSLWQTLHGAGLYAPTYQTWSSQIKK